MIKKKNSFSVKKNRKVQAFLVFLGLSTILWTISKLSKEYTHSVIVKTNYIELTSDKELQNKPKKTLELVLKTSGFNLIGYSFFQKKINIDLSKTQKKGNDYFYLTNRNLPSLQVQLPFDQTIKRVYPDTLFFDFGKLSSKEIKIIPQLNINYKAGYNAVGDIEIKPKTIVISGSEKQLSEITTIHTNPLKLNAVFTNFEHKIALDIPKEYHKIHFSNKEITIKGIVEKFTEANLEIPFEIINVPENYTIETFLKKIKVSYKVSLENYDKIHASDFKIVCDFDNSKHIKNTFLIPELIKKPNLVSNIKIKPKKIEFLIKK